MISHLVSARDAALIQFSELAGAGSKDCLDGREAVTRGRSHPKPAWHVLYVVIAVILLLLVVADLESPTDGWRILAECLGTVLILGVMALWVRANRLLALAQDAPHGAETLRSYVAYSPRPSSRRRLDSSGIEPGQRSLAQTRPAEEEDAKCFVE